MTDYTRYASLADRRVLITGGASGIGEAMVEAFVAQGARVAFLDVSEDAGRALVARLAPAAARTPHFERVDLRDLDALQRALAGLPAVLDGPIEVLINNAANDDRHVTADVTPAYWDDRIAVNLRHLFFTAQAVAPGMQAAGRGVILNLGSVSWYQALPDLALYQTCKAGIEGLSRALARDLGVHGVRVNTIVPGAVKTPRQDALWHDEQVTAGILASQCLKQRILPADIARLALFLASDDARMCTGHAYLVDAGLV